VEAGNRAGLQAQYDPALAVPIPERLAELLKQLESEDGDEKTFE
jgi:hypothetical protein